METFGYSFRRSTVTRRVSAGPAGRLGAAALLLMSSSCAYSYVDANNVQHVVGFVSMSIPLANPDASGPVSSAISVTSLGLHVYSGTANGSGIVVGYGKETVMLVPNNACIDLSSPGLCASSLPSSPPYVNVESQQP